MVRLPQYVSAPTLTPLGHESDFLMELDHDGPGRKTIDYYRTKVGLRALDLRREALSETGAPTLERVFRRELATVATKAHLKHGASLADGIYLTHDRPHRGPGRACISTASTP